MSYLLIVFLPRSHGFIVDYRSEAGVSEATSSSLSVEEESWRRESLRECVQAD
jgi:hypothetical protein